MKGILWPLIGLIVANTALADSPDISIGIIGSMDTSPYHAQTHDYSVMPLFAYDNDSEYIEGAEVGYYVINDDRQELRLKAYYDDTAYHNSDGHSDAMRGLQNRKATMMAGVSYQFTTAIGAFHSQLAADTLNHSNGLTANASWLNQLNVSRLILSGELGSDWANGKQTRYYYGISDAESRRSGLSRYHPKATFIPYINLTAQYPLAEHWQSFIALRSNFLSATVRHSPMVNQQQTYSLSSGLSYDF